MVIQNKMTPTDTITDYSRLNTLNYIIGNNFIDKVELIDCDKLFFIINNKDIFEPLLRQTLKGTPNTTNYDPFLMASKFLNKSRNSTVQVKYRQKKNVGRFYALKSLSLQNITRQIRQTICQDFYVDIDIKNCHPNILKFICSNINIPCPILTKYCLNREKFFKDNNISKEIGKILFLSIMNGGSKELELLKNPSLDILELYTNEIPSIHDAIIFKHYSIFQKHRNNRINNNIKFNHKASFMNIIICDIENKILQVMLNFFGNNINAVLCFDGIMLPSDTTSAYDIKGCEDAIFNELNIKMDLVLKPFDDFFDLSQYGKLPKFEQIQLDFYADFRNIVGKNIYQDAIEEWKNNSLVLIENGGKSFFLTKNTYTDGLTGDSSIYYKQVKEEDIKSNLKVKCNIINPKFDSREWNKLIQKFTSSEINTFLASLSTEEKKLYQKFNYEFIGQGTKKCLGYLQEEIQNRNINSFNSIQFAPFLKRKGEPNLHDSFNTFTGFPLERIILGKPIDFTTSRFYKHLKEELMDNNEDEFNHFLDHIADIIQDPINIKTNGHLFYTKQGMGKGMLGEFSSRLFGVDHVISFENTEAYFGKFNSDQSNKLLKIFEEVSQKGVAFNNHDRLKGDQSKTSERIEPKGIDPYYIKHCARFWYFSNNENALYIEGDDRRFTCHKANNRYANDISYFKGIWKEVKDINFCKNAFEFFATRKYELKNVYCCFETKFKKQQKELNLPNGIKFIKEIVEDNFNGILMKNGKIKSKFLGAYFKEYCFTGGFKFNLNSFKTQLKKIGIESKTMRYDGSTAKCYCLNIEKLQINFSEYLKDTNFTFDYNEKI